MNRESQIREQIRILSAELDDLTNDKLKTQEEYIRTLDWTKNCNARLKIHDFGGIGCGLPKYSIFVFGDVPKTDRPVLIIDNKRYENNLYYSKSNDLYEIINNYRFYTSDFCTMINFLDIVKFAKLDYDTIALRVLLAARKNESS